MFFEHEIEKSLSYLSSEEAAKTVAADVYWPKWNSPWWHMLLLHEMGETKKIPARLIQRYVAKLQQISLKVFPIYQHDMPEGLDPYRGSPCHCQLGNVYQVLAAWGLDVDQELPWIRPWFLKYQMADGGLNCDSDAYLIKNEVPSSMVGTIAVFEAVLLYTPRAWTLEETQFLDKGAQFLIKRKLMLGSETKHNASERESAKDWIKLCFPRYYFYDVLRGLNALLIWSEKTGHSIPKESIEYVVNFLNNQFPDGNLKIGRLSYAGAKTIMQNESGEWIRKQPATFFPLMESVGEVGNVSPYLSQQWTNCLRILSSNPELEKL